MQLAILQSVPLHVTDSCLSRGSKEDESVKSVVARNNVVFEGHSSRTAKKAGRFTGNMIL